MPNYVVVQCFQCRVFQSQQEKKEARFVCAMCGAAQSVRQVVMTSSRPSDCRLAVQQMNLTYGLARDSVAISPSIPPVSEPRVVPAPSSLWSKFGVQEHCHKAQYGDADDDPRFVTVPPPRASRATLPKAGRGAEASVDVMRRGIAKATLPQQHAASTKRDARASSAAVATAPSPCAADQPRLRELNCGNHAGFKERHLRDHEQANYSHEQGATHCQPASGGASKWNGFLEQAPRQPTTSTKWGAFVSPAVSSAAGLDDPDDGFTTSFD